MLLRESPSVMSHWTSGTFVTVNNRGRNEKCTVMVLAVNGLVEMTWAR